MGGEGEGERRRGVHMQEDPSMSSRSSGSTARSWTCTRSATSRARWGASGRARYALLSSDDVVRVLHSFCRRPAAPPAPHLPDLRMTPQHKEGPFISAGTQPGDSRSDQWGASLFSRPTGEFQDIGGGGNCEPADCCNSILRGDDAGTASSKMRTCSLDQAMATRNYRGIQA